MSSHIHGKFVVATAESSSWLKHDRVFFKKNPRCSHRLRKLLPGELLHAQAHAPAHKKGTPWSHVIIRQLSPGYRFRHFMQCEGLPDDLPHWETLYSLLWTAVASGVECNIQDLMNKAREIDRSAAACAGAEVLQ